MINHKMLRRLVKLEAVATETTVTRIWEIMVVHENEQGEMVREKIDECVWRCNVGRDGRQTAMHRVYPAQAAR